MSATLCGLYHFVVCSSGTKRPAIFKFPFDLPDLVIQNLTTQTHMMGLRILRQSRQHHWDLLRPNLATAIFQTNIPHSDHLVKNRQLKAELTVYPPTYMD